jgi:hypothetical protein
MTRRDASGSTQERARVIARVTDLARAVRLLEQEQNRRVRDGSPRDFVEDICHILNGGLSNNDYRTLNNTVDVVREGPRPVTRKRLTASAKAESAPQCGLYRVGHYWEIVFAGHETRLKDNDGLRYIHHLVARPNIYVEVQELRLLASRQHRADPDVVPSPTHERSSMISDHRAIAEHSSDIRWLEQEIGRAHEAGDQARADKLRAEQEAIERELCQAHRPIDRVRKKAQEAVRKRIVAAFKDIDQQIPLLGDHLKRSIKTGSECRYSPDPARPIVWVLVPPDSTQP